MEPETNKSRALSKEEIKGLLDLIETSKIINNKKTNATSNKMKIQEWERIAESLNATIATCRRTPQQLRLKWENLKKNSRKRSTLIRMEQIKTGGGPPSYFPPDEILDRVAALLGSTGEGLSVMFGGDSEPVIGDGGSSSSGGGTGAGGSVEILVINDDMMEMPSTSFGAGVELGTATSIPIANKSLNKSSGVKRRLRNSDKGCQARNLAIEEYFKEKKKILESKSENIQLLNENLKLENEKLRLEILKLKEASA